MLIELGRGTARLFGVEPEPYRVQRQIVLKTRRLVLTSGLVEDVESLHEVLSEAETMRYVRNGRPESHAEVENLIDQYIAEDVTRGWTKWRMADRDDHLVGRAGFSEKPGTRELSYLIRRDRLGAGLATEIAEALVGWHASNTEAVPLTAIVEIGNDARVRVLEKVGFREVGYEDYNGISCRAFAYPLAAIHSVPRDN